MSEQTETTSPAPAATPAPEDVEVPEAAAAAPEPAAPAPEAAAPAPEAAAPETQPEEPEFALREIVADDLDGISFEDAIAGTIIEFDDGDIVKGTIVKVDKDEVLLDIGYKSEGVIPARELSIRHDVDPGEIVTIGDEIEALVMQKEDKEGRLVLSKKRAQYE